jgi:D-glycero-alpha-D-manno-heptose-7-phosphate kinase
MIISKTPLRVSFAGGGSDLPAYYRRFGGAVVSTTVDKHVYIMVNRKFDHWIRLSYSKTEEVEHAAQVEHRIVRACLERLGIDGGIEITSIADIPSRGTGLGSSSAFTVGLIHALAAYQGQYCSAGQLAADACTVELDVCGARIGLQDQYASAFGGLNFIRFQPDDTVVVQPVICPRRDIERLQASLMSFYTGTTRSASDILAQQSDATESDLSAQSRLHRITELAGVLRDELQRGNIDAVGDILHENWMLKRELVGGISNPEIDAWYEKARAAGARGGKLLGAGGGGFLMFYVPPERQPEVAAALAGLRQVPFAFEQEGSRIVFYRD